MNFTSEQIEFIREWVSQNASISDVQKNISEKFGINMTYMDVRFLIDDIGAQLQDAPDAVVEPNSTENVSDNAEESYGDAPEDFGDMPQEQMQQPQEESLTQQNVGGVQVSVSQIQRPGAYVSGSVVFSDGESAEWLVDYQGRLSLVPKTQGYQPSQADVIDFQKQLQSALS